MFSFTEALTKKDGDGKAPSEQKHEHGHDSPNRNSSYLPEKADDPVSPDSTIVGEIESGRGADESRLAPSPTPGLELVRSDDETLKETAAGGSPYSDTTDKEFYQRPLAFAQKEKTPGSARRSGKGKGKLSWIVGAVVIVLVLAISLGVGLGVGLEKSKRPAHEDTLSKVGAFNGSGIALASQSFDGSAFGSIVMYFQHHSGQIRSAQLDSEGSWRGGDATEVVAVNAKNGTPIAAVAYARNQTAKWHIYYINTSGTISEVINSNTTNVWAPGPINDLNLRPLNDPNVGLQACWYGSFYSDVNYTHSPVPGQSPIPISNDSDSTVGIHLWYANTPTSFDSVSWIYGDTAWTEQQRFTDVNGHAGVGCYSWGPGSNTYVFFVDLENNVQVQWKDLNVSHRQTAQHPVYEWVRANISIPVFQNSSLGYTNYLYAQNPDLSISGYNITWAAENTSLPTSYTRPANHPSTPPPSTNVSEYFTINGLKGLPGTHLSVTSLPDKSGGNSLLAFYQTNGSDVMEFTRDFDAGGWTSQGVPLPDD